MRWCLVSNPLLCLGISGNISDPEYDPISSPLALQLKKDAPPENLQWTETGCLIASPHLCVYSPDERNVVLGLTGGGWTLNGDTLRLDDPLSCLTVMDCIRRPIVGADTKRTYCDSKVNTLNEEDGINAFRTNTVRGSYVKLAKCSANLPSQKFSAPSFAPSVSPSLKPTSLAPSISPFHTPSLSPSVSPSASPSFSPTASPSVSPSLSPSRRPSSRSPSRSPTRRSSSSDDGWWIGVVVGALLVSLGCSGFIYYYCVFK